MNVPFVSFQYRDLKVLRVLYLQANPDFCILYISTRSLKITKLVFGPLKFLEAPPPCGLKGGGGLRPGDGQNRVL